MISSEMAPTIGRSRGNGNLTGEWLSDAATRCDRRSVSDALSP
jgi:hypothetical protein